VSYIGLISGTSMDGIDAVLVAFGDRSAHIERSRVHGYPGQLRQALLNAASQPRSLNIADYGHLHARVAREFAAAATTLLAEAGRQPDEIRAIGSHGQTILHAPDAEPPFTLQLGDPGALAALTGIPVVADFRCTDLALGGQGAPLVPAFHQFAFGTAAEDRALVNIGGIANVTLLPAAGPVTGFDTGPGNALLDAWCHRQLGAPFDLDGAWAAGGTVDARLLDLLLADPYFDAAPPKSTGTDYFSPDWLNRALAQLDAEPAPQDIQATLAELTAATIAAALHDSVVQADQLAACGGGAHNADLIARLRRRLPDLTIESTSPWGIAPDWVEATAFAWLARERLAGRSSSLPTVTGARTGASLGGVYLPAGDGLWQV
jgi:anhydro-N-acetylmuramic acid kinase